MKTINYLFKTTSCIFLLMLLISCNQEKKQVVQLQDIQQYLELSEDASLKKLQINLKFWEDKLAATPTQFTYNAEIAGIENQLFSKTGNIEYLKKAEMLLKNAVERSGSKQSGYLRALARNYISQHQFKKALDLLETAEANGDKKQETIKMLFDVHLELGNNDTAKKYLSNIENKRSFDYLIRIAKWQDHEGNLDATISYMEEALQGAKEKGYEELVLWCETNLADYYGHHGDIEKSYQYYLKALEKNPADVYALKKIAWIAFSHDKNIDHAKYIISKVKKRYVGADLDLLAYQIALYDNNYIKQNFENYWSEVTKAGYGQMYNKYNFDILEANKEYKQAYELALKEVENRPTAQSYSLLALAAAHVENPLKGMEIIEKNKVLKSYEPEVLLRVAKVYALNNKQELVKPLKEELLEAEFELGPVKAIEIEKL
ncbi:cell surface protein [Wenyingzhuangia sp. chi5]|uniref:Cell surface protein n=1 Tax=Wenyingzhuangia gilva TaxID=3057677 RepID=A0ABT8VPI3_9FLAO|nr:cell surface protein [Wenyingzhuangia sp. chi5]MDO3693881.1 cell surface protein [Wenyingzhuangia sp. chi5]